jgi:rare lipoprotein A
MRYLFASFLLALLVSAGAALPAAAASRGAAHETSSERWSEGSRYVHRRSTARHRAVRTYYGWYDEEAAPRRRYHRREGSYRKRYTSRRYARSSRYARRHQRSVRRHAKTPRTAQHRDRRPKDRVAKVPLVPKPEAAPKPQATPAPAPTERKKNAGETRKIMGSHGVASFYWQPQRVASGGWFNPNAMTAAHKSLPFGTRVRVTHLGNGRSVEVKINDRGPYVAGRIIDLSKAAAGIIGMTGQGIARVVVEVLGK